MKEANENAPVYAIIPAAGTGSRMHVGHNKQFIRLGQFPLIIRTLHCFERQDEIKGYIVVASEHETDIVRQLLKTYAMKKCLGIAVGGETRQESVSYGLERLRSVADDAQESIVLIHDGARCFLEPEVIDRVIQGIKDHQACGAAVKVKDTVKQMDSDGKVTKTLDRGPLRLMQTPQGASFKLLKSAYKQAVAKGWETTDDLSVLEMAGYTVYLTEGDDLNIKLTTPSDRLLAEHLAERQDETGKLR